MKKATLIFNIINFILGLPAIFLALSTLFLFDNPNAVIDFRTWLFILALDIFPIVIVLSLIASWINYKKNFKLSFRISISPIIYAFIIVVLMVVHIIPVP
jgi:hypothetical protein